MTLRILLNFAPDQTAAQRSRLGYAFSLFCAIYDHQPVLEARQGECADIQISYSDDGTRAASPKTLELSSLYRPRPPREPAPPPRKYAVNDEETVLFLSPEPSKEPDWLGEIFEWVSCADEYSLRMQDSTEPVAFAESYVARHGLNPRLPYAGIAMRFLQRALCRVAPQCAEHAVSPIPSVRHFVVNTHDVDFLPSSRFGNFHRLVKNAGISLLVYKSPKLAAGQVWMALRYAAGAQNPLDQIPALAQAELQRGVTASYFFLIQRKHRRDGNYDLAVPGTVEQMQFLRRHGMEIGLHGSYRSLENGCTLGAEFEQLRKRGFAVEGNRQHWLRFTLDRLIPALEQAGATYDSSLGWYESIGFRGGACFAYPPYNFKNERASSFLEIPLAVMDVSLLFAKDGRRGWNDQTADLLAESRRYGWGGIALLWHPTTIGGGQYPDALGEVFWRLADERKSWQDTWISAGDFVAAVRQRYVEVGLLPPESAREPAASCSEPLYHS